MNHKLEREERVSELNPMDTLSKIGMQTNDVFCDIGAGTGIFSFAASQMTANQVYAVDISNEMLHILQQKKKKQCIKNVIIENSVANVPSSSCDLALLCIA